MAEQEKQTYSRIIFVEPNDVYDKDANNAQQGLSLTPKYEDFCISFNLIIEAFNRFKPQGSANANNSEGKTQKVSIQWGLTKEDKVKRRTSVLQGNRGKDTLTASDGSYDYSDSDYNYLTTYYTDLNFDSYKEKTEIEGLGVESVQISYESWYTPTVTIKFVDVRGSALFGREEAVHVNQHLTAENIFGAFFTMPYPLFRLQVKGFLGKPVTYQLTCSNFKGEFNSQTGNFEAVATFIGYSWSLLTDIPFAYLVAAPESTYIGAEYWNQKRLQPEWGLWNDGDSKIPPMKLFELFQNIKAALAAGNIGTATKEQSEEIESMTNEAKLLNEITTYYNDFINGIKKVNTEFFVFNDKEAKKQQLLLFNHDENLTLNSEIISKYEQFYEKLKGYTFQTYTNQANLTLDKAPNGWEECPKKLKFNKVFTIVSNSTTGKNANIQIDQEELSDVILNEKNGKLTQSAITDINDKIANDDINKFKPYCYLIDLYDTEKIISDRQKEIEKRNKKIIEEINDNINLNIIQILSTKNGDISNNDGFKPFIGNVFKLIFCHLETFCHIMFDSAQEIYKQEESGLRKASHLGIEFNKTDIKQRTNENVTPWPAILNNGVETAECGYKADNRDIYGWVGDLPGHKFIEEKVVYAIQEGIQKLVDNRENDYSSKEFSLFPILPTDYTIVHNVFGSTFIKNVSDLSGYLALRLTSIIGVLCGNKINSDLIKTIGRLDAYNLYSKVGSLTNLTNIIGNVNELSDVLEGIMFCNNDDKYQTYASTVIEGDNNSRYHSFETKKIRYNNQGRQPFFIKEGEKIKYVHFYDNNEISYVPSTLRNFVSYANKSIDNDFNYSGNSFEDCYFEPKIIEDGGKNKSCDWLYITDSSNISVIKNKEKTYINKYMFNIVTDSERVNQIKNKYLQLTGENLKVGEYEIKDELSEFVNKFLKVGYENTNKFFENVCYMLSGNANALSLDKNNFLPENNIDSKIPQNLNYKDWWNNKEQNSVKVNNEGKLIFNDTETSLSELVIQQFKVIFLDEECNIFGCPFYYMQNIKRDEESNDLYSYRRNRTKALLFLHTFKYNYFGTSLNVFNKGKINGATEEVPKGYLLFLGAMLWRKRYYTEHNNVDPIIFKFGTYQYQSCNVDYTLFNNKGELLYFKIDNTNNNNLYNYRINQLFKTDKIDYNIENQLIDLFENFAQTTFNDIANRYEIINIQKNIKKEKEFSDPVNLFNDIQVISGLTTDDDGDYVMTLSDSRKKILFKRNGNGFINYLSSYGFTNWLGKYSIITVNTEKKWEQQGLKMLFNENDKVYQDIFKDLYFNSYIIADSCYRVLKKNTQNNNKIIYIQENLLKGYLTGFESACQDIINSETVTFAGDSGITVSKQTLKNRDLSLAIYYYLKNLWDKWLIIAKTDAFDVKNFFDKNFIFTDSFYKNVYHYLAINCEKLLNAWTELADNGSVFHFLSRIVSDHGCIFLPVPDYVGFNGETQKHDIEMMEDLFRPLPYTAVESPSNNNKFIVMYTHSPAHINSEDNAYPTDSYDIWSYDTKGPTEIGNNLFSTTNSIEFDRDKDIATREGYNVPSFGVSFGRQNNHIFKNLKISMENPVMTEQAIKAQWQIALKGSSSTHSICFIGQDTFNVFSNYSYTIDVEMMGNAQICPLMYFQLTNVPLWRGTYMIFKVVHNMTAGNMTTNITAMKMSKIAQPFNTSFFIVHELPNNQTQSSSFDTDCNSENGETTYTTQNNEVYDNSNNGVVYQRNKNDARVTSANMDKNPPYRGNLPDKSAKSGSGKFKIGKAFDVIYDRTYAKVRNQIIGYTLHNFVTHCTRGPEIILRRALGLKEIAGSDRTDIFYILAKYGFGLKLYGVIKHIDANLTINQRGLNKEGDCCIEDIPIYYNNDVKLQIGDVAYTNGGNNKGHFCIWSGHAWVSDCWQKTMAVHRRVTEKFWVWSYGYKKNPINVTPRSNFKEPKCDGYFPLDDFMPANRDLIIK